MKIIHEWFEEHRGLLKSDRGVARQERRDARHLVGDSNKVRKVTQDVEKAFETGKHQIIRKAFKNYLTVMRKEFHDISNIVADYKTLMRRSLQEFDDLVVSIEQNPNEQRKDELKKRVHEFKETLKKQYEGYFQSMAGFESRNFSAKQILDEASIIKDIYYQAVQVRKAVNGFTKIEKSLINDERAGKSVPAHVMDERLKTLHTTWEGELSRHSKELQDIIQLLYDFQHHIEQMHEKVQELRRVKGYPLGWMEENNKILETLKNDLNEYIKQETGQARIFMSKEEHSLA